MGTTTRNNNVPVILLANRLADARGMSADIDELVTAIWLTDVCKDSILLVVRKETGRYAIYPLNCRIKDYFLHNPKPDDVEKLEGGVLLTRLNERAGVTEVMIHYATPEFLMGANDKFLRG